ncbi:hypothetical protein FJQ98_26400 [Lysinibacillus agricola]|uniref:Uncharacterized protein n=1 Tax=Lysinibacillus agricola TaxID=2590012 RepID=A0ABX7ASD8_9BACI|nr:MULTISPECIES: hypothetical protein [Lysinibacillus]KOS61077.1 hypothetical protein AN161_19025 [Lysinibacillus sp. FJAT-14222]QQP12551.1 hypothetical protein FJQ98_26400 [Lysinibacillus agricola]
MTLKISKEKLSIISLLILSISIIFSAQAFASSSTATKPLKERSKEGSIFYAVGGYAELRADILGGTGNGESILKQSIAWYPDPELYSVNVNSQNKPAANTHYHLNNSDGYYVVAKGDLTLNLKATLKE